MGFDGVLELLPHRGLDQSILVAVLVGLLTLLALTEAFGWVFVGLVIPGYLASIFVIQPLSGGAIVFESVLTFVLVRTLSDRLASTGAWSPLFGRERFFAIVLVSILVRQSSQLWILPAAVEAVDRSFGTKLLLERDFFSIGLVVVPLTANMFWKLDVRRGLLQIAVPVAVTWIVLEGLLLPHTNLSLSNLAVTYEDVALDFLASPKAYIILLVGAYAAAHWNQRYGWDYNGILIPTLLALAWFDPLRIGTTVVEAVVLYGLARLAIRAPGLRTMNLEGPRKVALVFCLGFLLKYVLGFVASAYVPTMKVTDLFGFGYVLTSLMAVKMLQKGLIGRVLLPTLHVSLFAFLAGSGIGFAFERWMPEIAPAPEPARAEQVAPRSDRLLASPLGTMAASRVRARFTVSLDRRLDAPPLATYRSLWRSLDDWLVTSDEGSLDWARRQARRLGLELRPATSDDARGWVLAEGEERLALQIGWDTAWLAPGAPGPVLEVPRPWSEAPAAEAAAVLCERMRCRAILASGLDGSALDKGWADATQNPSTPFHVAHGQFRSATIVQIRADPTVAPDRPLLHVHGTLPPDVRLDELWPVEGRLQLTWEAPPGAQLQWGGRDRFGVLRAHPDALVRLIAAHAPPPVPPVLDERIEPWLARRYDREERILRVRAGDRYEAPSESELRFLEEGIARPLLRGAGRARAIDAATLAMIDSFAALLGHRLHRLESCTGADEACWVLAEPHELPALGWGTLVVRDGDSMPVALEVPRPIRESGSWRLGGTLFKTLDARVLLLAGAETGGGEANPDPAVAGNFVTPFQAMHQGIHRELGRSPDALLAQVRGFAPWRPIDVDLVVGLGAPALAERQIAPPVARLLDEAPFFRWMRDRLRVADAAPELVGLAGQGNPQMQYSFEVGGAPMVMLWFSATARLPYQGAPIETHAVRFEQAGFAFPARPALRALLEPELVAGATARTRALEDRLEPLLRLAGAYAERRNIRELVALRRAASEAAGVELEAAWSPELGQPYLRLEARDDDARLRAIVLVDDPVRESVRLEAGDPGLREAAEQALLHRVQRVVLAGATGESP